MIFNSAYHPKLIFSYNIRVKNIASEYGNFQFFTICNQESYGYSMNYGFDEGEERTEQVKVGGSPGIVKCEINVVDRGSFSQKNDSCEIILNVNKCDYCYNEGIKCNLDKGYLEKCASNSCEMEIVEYCSEGCGYNSKKGQYDCKENISKTNYLPWLIVPIIIALIGFLIWINTKMKNKGKKK